MIHEMENQTGITYWRSYMRTKTALFFEKIQEMLNGEMSSVRADSGRQLGGDAVQQLRWWAGGGLRSCQEEMRRKESERVRF